MPPLEASHRSVIDIAARIAAWLAGRSVAELYSTLYQVAAERFKLAARDSSTNAFAQVHDELKTAMLEVFEHL